MTQEILPGAVLGVLGSGQLGRMFAIEARRLGYGVQVFSPESNTPAGQVADREWVGDYEDLDLLTEFSKRVSVVTLEFENVSTTALNHLEKSVPVRPGPAVLGAAQNRLREKTTLQKFGLPTAPFAAVTSLEELEDALRKFGGRGVIKTANWGYDGKGQKTVSSTDNLAAIWQSFNGAEVILEGFVDFACELSVIAVRNPQGDLRCYEPILNEHRNHILDVSISPAGVLTSQQVAQAQEIAIAVMRSLDVVGVLCVEMFLTKDGSLLINEIAPRPHNSGHLTIDAHQCCQFQQQVRAICGLPLGSTEQRLPAAMANLLGDIWQNGEPRWSQALKQPELKLHLYGKASARNGRKMGHMTALAGDTDVAARILREVRAQLVAE